MMLVHQLPVSYKVVKLSEQGPILEERPFPKLTIDHPWIIVKPLLVGVCRSDIREVTRERITRHDFGHEIVAHFVDANFPVPYNTSSKVCFDPHVTINRTSGFGEYVIASGSKEDLIAAFPLCPAGLENHRAVFMEPLACAHHAISRLESSLQVDNLEGLSIGILGAGNAGVLMGLIAKHLGANVRLITRNESRRLNLAKKHIFGKSELIDETTKINGLDGVILATTWLDERIFYLGADMLKDEGVLLLFGGTGPGKSTITDVINLDDLRRYQKEIYFTHKRQRIIVSGTYGVNSQDIRSSFRYLHASNQFPVEKLITDVIPLNNLCGLLLQLSTGALPFLGKYLIRI
jgi:cyclitol reductase